MKRLRQKESENKDLTPVTPQHTYTEGRDVRDSRANQDLHILDSPEEPLVQMT